MKIFLTKENSKQTLHYLKQFLNDLGLQHEILNSTKLVTGKSLEKNILLISGKEILEKDFLRYFSNKGKVINVDEIKCDGFGFREIIDFYYNDSEAVDSFGRVSGKKSNAFKKGISDKAIVQKFEKRLFEEILKECKKNEYVLIQKETWPFAKNIAIFISHDIDHYLMAPPLLFVRALRDLKSLNFSEFFRKSFLSFVYSFNAITSIHKKRLDFSKSFSADSELLKSDPWFQLYKIAEREKSKGIKSTFFFLNNDSFRDSTYSLQSKLTQEIVKDLSAKDFEIGLHAGFYSFNDGKEMSREKKELEDALGGRVFGIRQHRLLFEYPHTIKLQEESGFLYDSTDFFNDSTGFRRGTCLPYYIFDSVSNSSINILELPVAVMDFSLLLEQNKATFNPDNALNKCKELIDEVKENNGLFGLLWHPISFDNKEKNNFLEKKFDHGFVKGEQLFDSIVNYVKSGDVWFASGKEIAKWWKAREGVTVNANESGKELILEIKTNEAIQGLALKINSNKKIKLSKAVREKQLVLERNDSQSFIIKSKLKKNSKTIIKFVKQN